MKFEHLEPNKIFILTQDVTRHCIPRTAAYMKLGEAVKGKQGYTQVVKLTNGMPIYGMTGDTDVTEIVM